MDQDQAAASAYMAMLRRIHEVSGLTAGQIAAFSGLPRSTAYRFIDRKNNTLPKNRTQVEAFLKACRVSRGNITRMLVLWDEVSGNAEPDAATDGRILLDLPVDDDDVPAPKAEDDAEDDSWEWEQDLTPPHETSATEMLRPAATQPAAHENHLTVGAPWISEYRDFAVSTDAEVCLRCLEFAQQRKPLPRPVLVPTVHTGVTARLLPLAMLALTLYPLAATFWFSDKLPGSGFTGGGSAIIAVALLVIAARSTHPGQHCVKLTPTRLAAALFGGSCASLLAWAAMPVPPIAVLTGFAVFIMAPSWFDLTKLTSIATTPHGMFALIAALWCGGTLAAAAAYSGFPIFGSVLVAGLATATAVTVLSGNAVETLRSGQSRQADVKAHLHTQPIWHGPVRPVI
ncbi:hypothetical protein [Nocardia lasii]|uniref:HTH cro/C1-type domain-containing protein n=1 Tax=Nocardia lasii TaxID=1616107 RepID=A0ABW1JLZ0_9NOCA